EAQMTEIGKPAEHRDIEHFDGPALWKRLVAQPASTLPVRRGVAGFEDRVGPQPTARLEHGLPHGLWLRAVHHKPAKPLELAPVTAVEECVVSKAHGGDGAQAGRVRRGQGLPAVRASRLFSTARFADAAFGRHGAWPLDADTFPPASHRSPIKMRS